MQMRYKVQRGSGVQRSDGLAWLGLLQHEAKMSDLFLQLLALFFKLAQFVTADSDIEGLWCKCW